MSDHTLILGPIAFQAFEVPSRVLFGGKQRLAVHRLSDGSRAVEALGAEDADIVFSGVLSGAEAVIRAQALDMLRITGAVLELNWDVYLYLVVIREFHCKFENPRWIPYRICCTVTESILSSVGRLASLATQQAAADLTSAGTLLPPIQADTAYATTLLDGSDSSLVQPQSNDVATHRITGISNVASAYRADLDAQLIADSNRPSTSETFATTASLQASNTHNLWSAVIAQGLIGRTLNTLGGVGS